MTFNIKHGIVRYKFTTMTILGYLKSGETVLTYDNILKTISPDVLALLPEAIGRIYSNKKEVREIDMHRIVGLRQCVRISNKDNIVYAKRVGAKGHSKFVKDRKAKPCSTITIIWQHRKSKSMYVLIAAYIGKPAPPETWDIRATKESDLFWKYHAFIWGGIDIEPGSETKVVKMMHFEHVPEY